MTTIDYTPQGVCARHMSIDVEDGMIVDVRIVGGCNGNAQGITALLRGMQVEDAKARLSGISCKGSRAPAPTKSQKPCHRAE